jgi:putative hydrolase of the HAD superfamily
MMKKNWGAIFFDASGTLFHETSDFSSGIVLYEDAKHVVECLRKREFSGRRVRTGLITNWSARVHDVLHELRLADCFDVVVCSSDVEHGKPAAEPFVLAATSVGLDVSNCVHVGDSLRDDVFGASDAGFDAIWINRRHRDLHQPEKRMLQALGHPFFGDLEEAKEYLENLMREGVR